MNLLLMANCFTALFIREMITKSVRCQHPNLYLLQFSCAVKISQVRSLLVFPSNNGLQIICLNTCLVYSLSHHVIFVFLASYFIVVLSLCSQISGDTLLSTMLSYPIGVQTKFKLFILLRQKSLVWVETCTHVQHVYTIEMISLIIFSPYL